MLSWKNETLDFLKLGKVLRKNPGLADVNLVRDLFVSQPACYRNQWGNVSREQVEKEVLELGNKDRRIQQPEDPYPLEDIFYPILFLYMPGVFGELREEQLVKGVLSVFTRPELIYLFQFVVPWGSHVDNPIKLFTKHNIREYRDDQEKENLIRVFYEMVRAYKLDKTNWFFKTVPKVIVMIIADFRVTLSRQRMQGIINHFVKSLSKNELCMILTILKNNEARHEAQQNGDLIEEMNAPPYTDWVIL
jgi:hypothetical protein